MLIPVDQMPESKGDEILTRMYAGTSRARQNVIARVIYVLCNEPAETINIQFVLDRAGVGDRELNKIFGSPHGLVLKMVSDLSDYLVEPVEGSSVSGPVEEVLRVFGNRLVHAYRVSHLNALYRLALTEATGHPKLAREFFDKGPGKLRACLALFLQRSYSQIDWHRLGNPSRAADVFLDLLGDNLELSCNSDATGALTGKHRAVVGEAVAMLCQNIVANDGCRTFSTPIIPGLRVGILSRVGRRNKWFCAEED